MCACVCVTGTWIFDVSGYARKREAKRERERDETRRDKTRPKRPGKRKIMVASVSYKTVQISFGTITAAPKQYRHSLSDVPRRK